MTHAELQEIKKAAKIEFRQVEGVEGFGLGETTLQIYIRNPEVKKQLPSAYRGVPVTFVITGDIRPHS